MIHQTPASYLDGLTPQPHSGRLVFDEAQGELHFYEQAGGAEKFLLSLDKHHHFEIRTRGNEQVIEWRKAGAGNNTSEMLVISDLAFIRLIRDKFLSHKNIFWRYATFVWSESLGKVALALAAALTLTILGSWFFMQNSYHLVPKSWDKKIGDQAETGLKQFGDTCSSPQTVKDLKKFMPYLVPGDSDYKYEIQIVKSPVENAFAMPGGRISVFSETIRKAQNYEELVGILAHEAGHVERRHGMQQLSQYLTIRVVLALAFGMTDDATMVSTLADTGALLLLLKNSRDHERDADHYAAEKLAHAGISSKAIRKFFERISKEHAKEIEKVPSFVLTHPNDKDRVRFFEVYEAKHKAKFREAQARMSPALKELLTRKPVLTPGCIAPKEKAEDDDEE